MRSPYSLRGWLALSGIILVLDIATKYLAQRWLVLHQPEVLLPFFNFTLTFNRGAAFSFLSDASGWQRWFFVVVGLVISVVIVKWLARLTAAEQRTAAGLSCVLGGALGNTLERLWQGQVTDFLDLHYLGWHWPAFNVADSAITVGVVILLLDGISGARRHSETE